MTTTRRDFLKTAGAGLVLAAVPGAALAAQAPPLQGKALDRAVEEACGRVCVPPSDPNVRTVEQLVLCSDGRLDCYAGTVYLEKSCVLTLTCGEGFRPLNEPVWMPWDWSLLDPHMVFRVREPDGRLEQHGMDICVATSRPKKSPEGVWGIEVGPLKYIEVLYRPEGVGGRVHLRTYEVGGRNA